MYRGYLIDLSDSKVGGQHLMQLFHDRASDCLAGYQVRVSLASTAETTTSSTPIATDAAPSAQPILTASSAPHVGKE